jgi:hypothetical protein
MELLRKCGREMFWTAREIFRRRSFSSTAGAKNHHPQKGPCVSGTAESHASGYGKTTRGHPARNRASELTPVFRVSHSVFCYLFRYQSVRIYFYRFGVARIPLIINDLGPAGHFRPSPARGCVHQQNRQVTDHAVRGVNSGGFRVL